MDATIIIAIVPVVLLVAYIVWLVRAKITEGRDIDLREPITGVVICLVAVLLIGSMTASTVTYTYSEDTNTLYINQNLIDSNQPFDSYADEIKSVVIGNNCRLIETGTLDSLTNLEYVSIDSGVEVRSGAFGVTFEDQFGASLPVAELEGEFVGLGDGELYKMADESMFTVGTLEGKPTISGFSETAGNVVNLVVPKSVDGQVIKSIRYSAFTGSSIEALLFAPDSAIEKLDTSCFYQSTALAKAGTPKTLTTISSGAFNECSAMETIVLHEGVTSLPYNSFRMCTSLASLTIPSTVRDIGAGAFLGCTSLESLTFPEGLQTLSYNAFNGCTGLESVTFPSSITSIGATVFGDCTGITSVSFASGFNAETGSTWCPWTFYDTDGTTTLDKSVPANLAGFTFEGTASALVKVSPGQRTLTPDQIQMVHLHDAELQDLKDQISIEPLPLQPSLQTQEQEPVAA